MKIDLHLVSWNRPKMTELVIRTIKRNAKQYSDDKDYCLTVLDNGSDGDTPVMLERLKEEGLIDDLILSKTNMGLEAARNLLFKNATTSDYFIDIDNDCLPPTIGMINSGHDWIQRLQYLMRFNKDYAAIACRTEPMIGTGNIFEQADNNGDELVDFSHPGGSLRIMDSKAVAQVGGWDRDSPGRGHEEMYICGKLRQAGYKTAFATNLKCLHLFGTRGDSGTDRWGYPAEYKPEETGHSDIWHPKLNTGDDWEEVALYAGNELADWYFHD